MSIRQVLAVLSRHGTHAMVASVLLAAHAPLHAAQAPADESATAAMPATAAIGIASTSAPLPAPHMKAPPCRLISTRCAFSPRVPPSGSTTCTGTPPMRVD